MVHQGCYNTIWVSSLEADEEAGCIWRNHKNPGGKWEENKDAASQMAGKPTS